MTALSFLLPSLPSFFILSASPPRPPASTTPSFCITHTLLNNEDEVNPTVTSAPQTDFIFTDLLQLHHRPLGIPPTHCAQTLYQAIASAQTRFDRHYRPLNSNYVEFSPSPKSVHLQLQSQTWHHCVATKHGHNVQFLKYQIQFFFVVHFNKEQQGLSESKEIYSDILKHMM